MIGPLHRRGLLRLLFAACSIGLAGRAASVGAVGSTALQPDRRLLEQLFAHPDNARMLGRFYLASTQGSSARAAERAELARMLRQLQPGTTAELRGTLRARIRDDFAEGNIVLVRGWYLARTEATICSLLAG